MSVPSDGNRVFWGVNTTYTLSGVQQDALSTIQMWWGYRIHEEAVTGTNIPYLGTGVFHGEVEVDVLASSDNLFDKVIGLTAGQVLTFGMTWLELDTQGTQSGRTWTISGKFTEYRKISDRDNVVRYRMRGIIALEPTVV